MVSDVNSFDKSELSYIELVFENVDYARIPIEYIDSLFIDNISLSASYVGEKFFLEYKAKDVTVNFEDSFNDFEYMSFGLESEREKVKDRILKWQDICCIELGFNDGRVMEVCPYWIGTDETNICQRFINSSNTLSISKCNKDVRKWID